MLKADSKTCHGTKLIVGRMTSGNGVHCQEQAFFWDPSSLFDVLLPKSCSTIGGVELECAKLCTGKSQ